MKQAILSITVFLSLSLLVMACGRLNDKFGRLKNNYTRVQFHSMSGSMQATSQSGGVMVYFSRIGSGNGGNAFAFPNEIFANNQTIVVPNGSFKVYAFSYDGAVTEGQVRCALGNGGSDVNLVGTNVTVGLDLTAANCSFGNDSVFSTAEASMHYSGNATNFDTLSIQLCSNFPSSCSVATGSNVGVRVRLFSGEKQPGTPMFIAMQSLLSNCFAVSSGSVDTNVRIPVGPGSGFNGVSPPVGLVFYADTSCATSEVARFDLTDGLNKYYAVATTSNVFLTSPSTDTKTYLKIQQTF